MKIETSSKGNHASIILRGEFDTNAADSFLAAIDQALAAGQNRIAVSLRYVKYLNSTALGAVVRARGKCKEQDGDLVITRPSSASRQIVTSMGLETVLVLFDDEAEANDFLDGQGPAPEKPAAAAVPEENPAVMFSFDDERRDLFSGKSHHGVGQLASINAHGLMFLWNPTEHGCTQETAAKMFANGTTIHCKLRMKMVRKEYFVGDAKIQNVTNDESGDTTIAVMWTDLPEGDREALTRHAQEVGFLRRQANKPTDDSRSSSTP